MESVQSVGALASAGWNGGEGGDRANSGPVGFNALEAMFRAAVSVSVGVVMSVAAENSAVQFELALLSEFTHEERIFASVCSLAWGTVPLPAGVVVRAPVAPMSTMFVTVANAFARPVVFPGLVPRCVPSFRKRCSAVAAATVLN